MTDTPLISIITVCRNAEQLIGPTVKSVVDCAAKMNDLQYIIIDGASTDKTIDIAKEIIDAAPVRLINPVIVSEKDSGIYDAMNKGLELASGDYVMFINAGDTLHSDDTLQTIKNAIKSCYEQPGVVYGDTLIVNADRTVTAPRHITVPDTLTLDSMKKGMVVCHQAFVALRKLTAPFDTRYRLSADYDWCIRCLQRSRCNLHIDTVIADYLYQGASTRQRGRSLRERFKIMCYYFGTIPTIARHISFIPRRLKRRRIERQF